MSPRSAIVIGPDKPRGPKRRLTNTGVNTFHLVPSMGLIVSVVTRDGTILNSIVKGQYSTFISEI